MPPGWTQVLQQQLQLLVRMLHMQPGRQQLQRLLVLCCHHRRGGAGVAGAAAATQAAAEAALTAAQAAALSSSLVLTTQQPALLVMEALLLLLLQVHRTLSLMMQLQVLSRLWTCPGVCHLSCGCQPAAASLSARGCSR